ncbi:MAG: hypothetical protein R3330_10450 [Saprospiraceae bacterium]|nr:hypothetical protein [Saprospiraceae bacterium]
MKQWEKNERDADDFVKDLDTDPIPVLEQVRKKGRVWEDLAAQYGVDNPDPPWKVSLEGTCEVLAEESCALDGIERRWEEDELSDTVYEGVPYPERQLLALAHSMIRRGLIDEEELARRMEEVNRRLNMA